MNKCFERANDRHFWNPRVVSYAMVPRCRPNSRVFFLIVTSIVYASNLLLATGCYSSTLPDYLSWIRSGGRLPRVVCLCSLPCGCPGMRKFSPSGGLFERPCPVSICMRRMMSSTVLFLPSGGGPNGFGGGPLRVLPIVGAPGSASGADPPPGVGGPRSGPNRGSGLSPDVMKMKWA